MSRELDVIFTRENHSRPLAVYPKVAHVLLEEQLIEKGKIEGMREGKLEGKLLVKKEDLLKLLDQKFGAVTEADKRKIIETRDLDRLDQAIGLILKTETMAAVLKPLD